MDLQRKFSTKNHLHYLTFLLTQEYIVQDIWFDIQLCGYSKQPEASVDFVFKILQPPKAFHKIMVRIVTLSKFQCNATGVQRTENIIL